MRWKPFRISARQERKVEESAPAQPSSRDLADAARDSRNWQLAAQLYQEHLSEHPDDFGIWVQKGHAEKEAGAFAEAEKCYRTALELSPNDADLWLQIGHLKKLLLRFGEAADAYQKSLALGPDQKHAQDELSRLNKTLSNLTVKTVVAELRVADLAPGPKPDEPKTRPAAIATIDADDASNNDALAALAEAAVRKANPLLAATLTRLMVRNDPLNGALWLKLGDLFDALARPNDVQACREVALSLQDRAGKTESAP